MDKKNRIILCVLALIASSCVSKKIPVLPPEVLEVLINTDTMLINKYSNADTADFQTLERAFSIYHMPTHYWRNRNMKFFEERRSMIQKKSSKYPKTKISNINEVCQWLMEFYDSGKPCDHVCDYFIFSQYKQVDDGFLIRGEECYVTDMVLPFCWQFRLKTVYLVGYDHNLFYIKGWNIDPCPNAPPFDDYTDISVKVHLPEFENTEVRYPELSGSSISSFILKNVRYPAIALEQRIRGTVLVSFIVETNGSVSKIEILKSIDPSLDKEAVRCVKSTDGQWISGMLKGEKTPMEIKIEFKFVFDYNRWYYDWRER